MNELQLNNHKPLSLYIYYCIYKNRGFFMNKYKNIGIIACDLRQVHMAKYLMNKGYSINIICSEKLSHNKEYKEISFNPLLAAPSRSLQQVQPGNKET